MKTAENSGQERKEASYPYYDLEACINFAEQIKSLGGSKGTVKKALLARQVGLAESTPSFFQKLSASKVFGITDGWGAYGLTDLGRKFFYPQSQNDKQEALLEIFTSPEAFRLIVERFDGEKLPTTDIMGNIFHQELGIPDSWKDRVAQMFVRSAHFAGIIDDGGFLRYRAAVHTAIPVPVESKAPTAARSAQEDPLDIPASLVATDDAPKGVNVWSYSSQGKQLKVQTPEGLSKELWDKLNAYVQI